MVANARTLLLQKVNARLGTFLDDTCTVSRESNSYDETGAPTGRPEIVASGVSCRVIAGKSDTENIGDQESLTEWYRLIVPVGTELEVNYIVTLSDDTEWHVIDVITQRSEATDAQALIKRERREKP